MTITINLSPEIETQLINRATIQGKEVSIVASEIITSAIKSELHDSQEAIIGIEKGLNDFDKGNFREFKKFAEEQSIKYDLSLE